GRTGVAAAGGPLELPGEAVGAEAGGHSHLLQAPAAGLRVAWEQIPMLVGLAGQLRFGHGRVGVVGGVNEALTVGLGATGIEPSQQRCLAAVIPAQVSSARASCCVLRSGTPKHFWGMMFEAEVTSTEVSAGPSGAAMFAACPTTSPSEPGG